jgi:hypothetical protein
MKTPLLLAFLLLIIATACTKSDVVPTFHEKRALLVDHNWKVGLLSIDDGADESANFQRITLDFGEQNSVVAISTTGQTFYGNWSYTHLETGMEQLRIQFTGSDLLSRLNASWQIEAFLNNKLELKATGASQEASPSRLHLLKL